MPQPIEEGMVLGGRYLITGHVLTSADQDMVLDGRDQVLNRDVSILVASSDHASQVATSARELATGERQGTIQVLDLGLSEGRTYLIAGGSPTADELLDMTREQQVYVEPFFTDTLGSEIFGEARTYEPHVYEDDEDYYEDLEDGFAEGETEKRRPKFLRGISERLSQRLGSDDAAKDAVNGEAPAGGAGLAAAGAADGEGHDAGPSDEHDPYRSAVRRADDKPLPDTVSDDEWTGTHDEVTVDPRRPQQDAEPARTTPPAPSEPTTKPARKPAKKPSTAATPAATPFDGDDTGETPTAAVATPPVGRHSPKPGRSDAQREADRPKVTLWDDDESTVHRPGLAAGAAAGALGAAGAASGSAGATSGATGATGGAGGASGATGGAGGASGATGGAGGHGHHGDGFDARDYESDFDEDDYEEDEKPRGARWIVGGILVLLLILGAVFAFNILGNSRDPLADGESTEPGSEATSSTDATQDSQLPAPEIASASRVVPDLPGLSAETDGSLPNAIDGNPATAWQTYSFAQPQFGGFASSMALVIELEEPSAISQVDITQNNGSGGSFSVMLSDTGEVDDARQIAEGSFTGPDVSVPVPAEEGATAEAQYVIINFTELPQLSNASANLPYGLRIAEVEVN